MKLPVKILIGLVLGIFTGLFFGESVGFLKVIGDVFVMSLQMTVLPYIMVSLISGLGMLSPATAILLVKKSGWVLLVLWLLGLLLVLVMPFGFPDWESATFFSTSLIEEKPGFDFLEFYIPFNIFHSLSENLVPAVVIFSLALGIALMQVKNKKPFLDVLSPISSALGLITTNIVKLAPYGVFAILANSFGTMRFEALEQLQIYLFIFVVTALFLTFWVLPALVTSLTPIGYKEFVNPIRTALITAFATGNLFIVLPILVEKSKTLLENKYTDVENASSSIEVIVPVSYSFPSVGKILSLGFILFAGWMANAEIPVSKYPGFAISGFFNFFGDKVVAVQSLLDLYRIPADTFQFFLIVDNLVGARFGVLAAAMGTFVIAILGASGIAGKVRIRWSKLIKNLIITLILLTISIGSVRVLYELVVHHEYHEYETLVSMEMMQAHQPAKLFNTHLPSPLTHDLSSSRLDLIKNRGFIRVGYYSNALPFAFVNQNGEVVGFDIEMAHILAEEMHVDLHLVHIEKNQMKSMLEMGYVDIIMSGVGVTLELATTMGLSASYTNQTYAYITKDYRHNEFNSRDKVKSIDSLRIACIYSPYYINKAKQYSPKAEIIIVNSAREFFLDTANRFDAMAYSAEAGSVWSLIYPDFSVAIPIPDVLQIPLTYAFAIDDPLFKNYLDTWLDLKKKDETIDRLYDHWILGKDTSSQLPRWSIIHDVLHWVK